MGNTKGAPQQRTDADGERARMRPGEDSAEDSIDDDLPPDEGLDRILGDADLLYRLQLRGYAPEQWRRPSEEFARYGFDAMVGWLFAGRIWYEVYKKTGRHPRRPEAPFDRDAVQTLASDTVVAALDAFLENVLKSNRWDPQKGASLKIYFVGQWCFRFPTSCEATTARCAATAKIPTPARPRPCARWAQDRTRCCSRTNAWLSC